MTRAETANLRYDNGEGSDSKYEGKNARPSSNSYIARLQEFKFQPITERKRKRPTSENKHSHTKFTKVCENVARNIVRRRGRPRKISPSTKQRLQVATKYKSKVENSSHLKESGETIKEGEKIEAHPEAEENTSVLVRSNSV